MENNSALKYCVVGAGAIGMLTAAYLADIKKDVTLLCRGESLDLIREKGVEVRDFRGTFTVPVKVAAEADYTDTPDVIILGVKVYSLDSVIPFLNRVCTPETIVIPMENAVNLGEKLQAKMSVPCKMCSGVVYTHAKRVETGVVEHTSRFHRVVFAPQDGIPNKRLWRVRLDMLDTPMAAELQTDPVKCCLRKFIRVSCISAICCYYNDKIGVVRRNPEALALYQKLCSEICDITAARGAPFEDEAYDDAMTQALFGNPNFQPSMKTDMDNGRPMEVDTQFFDVYELGRKLGLPMEAYGMISRHFGYKGEL